MKKASSYVIALLGAVIACTLVLLAVQRGRAPAEKFGRPSVSINLTDQSGRPVSATDFRGRWVVVYFGFTNCPDVCPLGLVKLHQVFELLGAKSRAVQVVFITVDPERDTGPVVGSFVRRFDAHFVGLTGSVGAIKAAVKAFGAYSEVVSSDGHGIYSVAHSSFFHVLDPSGRQVRRISTSATPKEIVAALNNIMTTNAKSE